MLVSSSRELPIAMPIFIVGSGRSGTTLLFSLLCGHPDLAWVPVLTDLIPQFPPLSMLCRFPGLKAHRFLQPSTEAINMYNYCGITLRLLKEKGTSLTEIDITHLSQSRLQHIVWAHTKWMGKSRFINKNTGNTLRVRYLQHMFPDALFIHIIRNGYGVCNSLSKVGWWPGLELWWLDKTPQQWQDEGGNPYELCGLHWKRQVTELLEHKNLIPSAQYMECRYEDLITNTQPALQDILTFCQLEKNQKFTEHISRLNIKVDTLDKWRANLGSQAKRAINRAAGDLMIRLGYDIEN